MLLGAGDGAAPADRLSGQVRGPQRSTRLCPGRLPGRGILAGGQIQVSHQGNKTKSLLVILSSENKSIGLPTE